MRKAKNILSIVFMVALILTMVFPTINAADSVRTVVKREDAKPGEPITPKDFPLELLPGLDYVGAVPKKKYFIAFSNGDMGNDWRRAFVEDINAFAQKYVERFGLKYTWTNAGNNTTKQLSDIQSLLAQRPDLLIISPNESTPLAVAETWARRAGVPIICVDRTIDVEPGTGSYVSLIQMDCYLNGVANGISVVKKLTEKYGKPMGNVVEIAGILGSSSGIERSQGQHWVLSHYPDIRIIASRPGEFDKRTSYQAMQDLLTTYPKGQIDAVIGGCDATGLAAIEAIKAAGRDELLGYVWGIDGDVQFLEAILRGEAAESNEFTPFYGMLTFEYAIHYLNGEEIPAHILLPGRNFAADTPEKRAKLEEVVSYCKANGYTFPPMELGGHDVFVVDPDMLNKYYPTFYKNDPRMVAVEPFTVQPPIKTPSMK